MKKKTKAALDTGYQGVQKGHANTVIPTKKTKLTPLTKNQKKANRELSSERVLVENVIGWIERFRLLAERYRSRRRRFGLRLNLISAFYNWEIDNVNQVSG